MLTGEQSTQEQRYALCMSECEGEKKSTDKEARPATIDQFLWRRLSMKIKRFNYDPLT